MTHTSDEHVGPINPALVAHRDYYDTPEFVDLLRRVKKACDRARKYAMPEPEYVVLTERERIMFLSRGAKRIPRQIYGVKILIRDEVIFP